MRVLQRQFLLFCLSGTAAFVLDVIVLYTLATWLGWYAARAVSFTCAASFTWWFNRSFTFAQQTPARVSGTWKRYFVYVLAMAGGATLNFTVYGLVLGSVHGPASAAVGVALGSLTGLFFNFSAARLLLWLR